MNRILFIVWTLFFVSCKDKNNSQEQIVFDRIEFVYNLKQTVDERVWKTFDDKEYDLPLIYFTDTGSYVANPTEKFLSSFESYPVFQTRKIKVYKTANRVDSLPFHMETAMTLGDPTDEYHYHSPFMMCSSYEETFKTIPQVRSTEQWATMVIHEYFHGFQFRHKQFLDYYEKEIAQVQEDSLKLVYKGHHWFKKSIDEENQLLLDAIDEKDSLKTRALIAAFFDLRAQRRKTVSEQLQLDISKYEKCYETTEGTARYVEFSLYNIFSERRPDHKLSQSDSLYKSFEQFRDYNIQKDEWLYLTEKTAYFYATGFNMARLLDKLGIEYKSRLFKEAQITMEDLLMDLKW